MTRLATALCAVGTRATAVPEGGVRGTGFLWGKMLTQPGRLSSVMMHNIDWAPTLISAAGGDGAALSRNASLQLDGVDCWDAIALTPGRDHTPPRSSILLHLVGPPDGDASASVPRGYPYYSAMLMDDWKLCVLRAQRWRQQQQQLPLQLTHLTCVSLWRDDEQHCRHGRGDVRTPCRCRSHTPVQCLWYRFRIIYMQHLHVAFACNYLCGCH